MTKVAEGEIIRKEELMDDLVQDIYNNFKYSYPELYKNYEEKMNKEKYRRRIK